jgi:predicted  nucleic acid-binding Zn-ribbon protein
MREQDNHDDHSYALDLQEKIRHISEVERGRKGYICTGCGQDMIARKGNINVPHFAHDPKDTAKRGKCTYSEETFRHKLGKEILQRIKRIKVPSLRKFPADGQNGAVYIIRESWFVVANSVEIEMPFYENEQGQILYGRNAEWKDDPKKYLMIQPDVAFFDATGKPILLIELVATHKINDDKYLRIRNLGLDTIQVSLPIGPSTVIEETFNKTAHTKWVYNYERENTEYQYVPPRTSQDVLSGDEFEERLVKFERSYKCKLFEINGALRRFRTYLESEQFTSARESINQKIRRTERNTASARKQWRELQERIKAEVSQEFEPERVRLDELESELILEKGEFERSKRDLEDRYKLKDRSLRVEEKTYRPTSQDEIDDIEERIRQLGANPEPLSDRIEKLRAEEGQYEQSIKYEEIDIDDQTGATDEKIAGIDNQILTVELETSGLADEYAAIEIRVRAEIKAREDSVRSELKKFEHDLRSKFDRDRDLSVGAIKDRDIKRTPRLNRKIKELVEAGMLLDTIPISAEREQKLRDAREELDKGSYKKWT